MLNYPVGIALRWSQGNWRSSRLRGFIMAVSAIGLLKSRRLGPLCLTQSCGAFNDNLVKNALVVLALFKLGSGGTGLTALAGALVIAPFILFSAMAGQIADRFSKPRVIVIAKI